MSTFPSESRLGFTTPMLEISKGVSITGIWKLSALVMGPNPPLCTFCVMVAMDSDEKGGTALDSVTLWSLVSVENADMFPSP